jgi:menaquinol-cytochrome c reductase cytochrome b/c subunit
VNRADQEAYKRDYAQAKKEGKPFYPYAIYKDHVVAVIVFAGIIGMAIWQRVGVGPPVYSATSTFEPRPEWYFFFLFQMLKIFKNQNAFLPVIMATFIVPNVLMVLLLVTPFIDRRAERRINRRPFALSVAILVFMGMAWLTYQGETGAAPTSTGSTITFTGITPGSAAAAGEAVYLANGCASCHMVKGVGGQVGPNLTNVGTLGKSSTYTGTLPVKVPGVKGPTYSGESWFVLHTQCPTCATPGSGMPAFASLTPVDYQNLATFLNGLGTTYK